MNYSTKYVCIHGATYEVEREVSVSYKIIALNYNLV